MERSHIIKAIRSFLLSTKNKELLVFLFFFCLSGIFWLLMTLNETYETEVCVEVNLTNVPRNIVITNDISDTVRFTVRDKGFAIANYLYAHKLHPLSFDFMTYADGKGHGSIPVADIQRQIYQQLFKSSKIVTVKTDKLEFYYNYGRHKKVAVRMLGRATPGHNYYLAQVRFEPESVLVYSSQRLLDSIREAFTVKQRVSGFTEPKGIYVSLAHVKGAKFMPNKVKMTLYPDIMTEGSVEVPIVAINMPDDKELRTFPSKVAVKFVVGANMMRRLPKSPDKKEILPNGFQLIVDYNEIKNNKGDYCPIHLRSVPNGIQAAHPVIDEVDYLIEQR